jgi:hypothetical protein
MYSAGGAKLKAVDIADGTTVPSTQKKVRENPCSSVVDQVSIGWR